MAPSVSGKPGERGAAMAEFMLCIAIIWIPMFLGTVVIGFSLVQAIQVTQVCRDAGHMYAFNTDLSQTSNRYLVASLAPNLKIDPTGAGGDSVLILSTITYVDDQQCPGGKKPGGKSCQNYKNMVFSKVVIVGTSTLHASAFQATGRPLPATLGDGSVVDPLDDVNAQAPNFKLISITKSSQIAYVSELYAHPPAVMNSFLGQPWITSVSVF